VKRPSDSALDNVHGDKELERYLTRVVAIHNTWWLYIQYTFCSTMLPNEMLPTRGPQLSSICGTCQGKQSILSVQPRAVGPLSAPIIAIYCKRLQ
jgi:hypothetical protein